MTAGLVGASSSTPLRVGSAAAPDGVIGSPVEKGLDKVHVEHVAVVGIVLNTDPKGEPALGLIGLYPVRGRVGNLHAVGSLGDVLATGGRAKVEHVAILVVGVNIGSSSQSQGSGGGDD